MSWLVVQNNSRKPGAGDADVLNRVKGLKGISALTAAAAAAKASQAAGSTAGASAFTPAVAPAAAASGAAAPAAKAAKAAKATARPASAVVARGPYGLPSWLCENKAVLYKSSSGSRLKVVVKEVTKDKVTIVFDDKAKSWKRFTHEQVLSKDGPLAPFPHRGSAAASRGAGRSRSPRQRSAGGSAGGGSVELLSDEEDGDVVVASGTAVEVLVDD
eukprot:TRINITY_DN38603_c0_g1_i1.p1 TRINITY_DN38603_c0_g1~~TRINITY_DN38603_c0_g1_i1.p1  ORF type:complete len:216 (+),score=47.22 TRINITY_DN38603_c0_g1_i1:43-690(+)